MIVPWLASTLRGSVTLLFPALGEMLSQRSGVLNIGLEGYMLMGALCAYLGAVFTGNPWFGMAMGALAGMLTSLLYAYFTITLKSNQIIGGIAIWLLSMGFSSFIYRTVGVMESIKGFAPIQIPVLSELPVIGPILFQQSGFTYLGLLLVLVFAFILFRTSFGLIVRGTGQNPLAVDIGGHNVFLIRYISVLTCGAMAGLAGAYLPLALVYRFGENMTAGSGFIALGIVFFGNWNPWGILGGALLFSAFDMLQLQLRAMKVGVPAELLLMLPYVVTIAALVIIGRVLKGSNAPRKLALPYLRGEE